MNTLKQKAPFSINLEEANKEDIKVVYDTLMSKGASAEGESLEEIVRYAFEEGFDYIDVDNDLELSATFDPYSTAINPEDLDTFLGAPVRAFYMMCDEFTEGEVATMLSAAIKGGATPEEGCGCMDEDYPSLSVYDPTVFKYFGVDGNNSTYFTDHAVNYGDSAELWAYDNFASVYGDVLGRNNHTHAFVPLDGIVAKSENLTNGMMALANKYNVDLTIKGDKILVTAQSDTDYKVSNGEELMELLSALEITDKYLD